MDSGDYVGLKVGGKIYGTSRATLTRYPNTFFTAMLDGSIPVAKDGEGNYLIDRDGKIFRHVLNYIRCGELVVPPNFSEFGLLEREADFFLLQELKLLIAEREGIGLMFYNGNLFITTRKTLLREKDSLFTKILNGDITLPRDSQGNYVMDRDGRHFHHVIQYLRDGGIFTTIKSDEFDHLKKEAQYFKLTEFAQHVESVKSMQSTVLEMKRRSGIPPHRQSYYNIDFYYRVHSPSVAYASYESDIFKLHEQYCVGEGATAGVVDMNKIRSEKPATLQDVLAHFKCMAGRSNIPGRQFRDNCTKVEFRSLKQKY